MSGEPPRPAPASGGLCPRCAHVRRVESDRKSVFLMCTLAKGDPRFRRYPPQPVVSCPGFAR